MTAIVDANNLFNIIFQGLMKKSTDSLRVTSFDTYFEYVYICAKQIMSNVVLQLFKNDAEQIVFYYGNRSCHRDFKTKFSEIHEQQRNNFKNTRNLINSMITNSSRIALQYNKSKDDNPNAKREVVPYDVAGNELTLEDCKQKFAAVGRLMMSHNMDKFKSFLSFTNSFNNANVFRLIPKILLDIMEIFPEKILVYRDVKEINEDLDIVTLVDHFENTIIISNDHDFIKFFEFKQKYVPIYAFSFNTADNTFAFDRRKMFVEPAEDEIKYYKFILKLMFRRNDYMSICDNRDTLEYMKLMFKKICDERKLKRVTYEELPKLFDVLEEVCHAHDKPLKREVIYNKFVYLVKNLLHSETRMPYLTLCTKEILTESHMTTMKDYATKLVYWAILDNVNDNIYKLYLALDVSDHKKKMCKNGIIDIVAVEELFRTNYLTFDIPTKFDIYCKNKQTNTYSYKRFASSVNKEVQPLLKCAKLLETHLHYLMKTLDEEFVVKDIPQIVEVIEKIKKQKEEERIRKEEEKRIAEEEKKRLEEQSETRGYRLNNHQHNHGFNAVENSKQQAYKLIKQFGKKNERPQPPQESTQTITTSTTSPATTTTTSSTTTPATTTTQQTTQTQTSTTSTNTDYAIRSNVYYPSQQPLQQPQQQNKSSNTSNQLQPQNKSNNTHISTSDYVSRSNFYYPKKEEPKITQTTTTTTTTTDYASRSNIYYPPQHSQQQLRTTSVSRKSRK